MISSSTATKPLRAVGDFVSITGYTFDVCLPSGEHVTATMVRG